MSHKCSIYILLETNDVHVHVHVLVTLRNVLIHTLVQIP